MTNIRLYCLFIDRKIKMPEGHYFNKKNLEEHGLDEYDGQNGRNKSSDGSL